MTKQDKIVKHIAFLEQKMGVCEMYSAMKIERQPTGALFIREKALLTKEQRYKPGESWSGWDAAIPPSASEELQEHYKYYKGE